jgi:hypothetical protein
MTAFSKSDKRFLKCVGIKPPVDETPEASGIECAQIFDAQDMLRRSERLRKEGKFSFDAAGLADVLRIVQQVTKQAPRQLSLKFVDEDR